MSDISALPAGLKQGLINNMVYLVVEIHHTAKNKIYIYKMVSQTSLYGQSSLPRSTPPFIFFRNFFQTSCGYLPSEAVAMTIFCLTTRKDCIDGKTF